MSAQSIARRIAERLNLDDAFDAGASCRDAVADDDTVNFTFPATVISGACRAVIRVFDDGRVHDDTCDTTHPNYAEWETDLINMIRGF